MPEEELELLDLDPSQAGTVRDELMKIKDANGGALTPAAIVYAAADEAHPLHNRFQWDDTVAAHKYRLGQARQLVRTVRVQFVDGRGEYQEVREFRSVRTPGQVTAVYKPLSEIVGDEVLTAQMLRQMDAEWRAFKRRYGHTERYVTLLQQELDNRTSLTG